MDSVLVLQSWTRSSFCNHELSPRSTIKDSFLVLQSRTHSSFYNQGLIPRSTIKDSVLVLQSRTHSSFYNQGLSPRSTIMDSVRVDPISLLRNLDCGSENNPTELEDLTNMINKTFLEPTKDFDALLPETGDDIPIENIRSYHVSEMSVSKKLANLIKTKATGPDDLKQSSEAEKRRTAIQVFNKENRWRKRGMSIVPLRWGVMYVPGLRFTAYVAIFRKDGTVCITHGGIEIGQGIDTKVCQVAAHILGYGLTVDQISIRAATSFLNPNGDGTGGSITSEICCEAIINCCNMLKERISPIAKDMPQATWAEIIDKCYGLGVDLSAKY
ncbi:xanthine dehydrogenase oxidase-like, partial [Paramuricea clavata]